jgi:uncharacterized coiled-coil protein SlyX
MLTVLLGCTGREEELEKEKAKLVSTADSLITVIQQRDTYFDDVVRSINAVYNSLEEVREKEAAISEQAGQAEAKFSVTNEQARTRLLNQIASIDTSLRESRKKIDRLQVRIRSMNKQFAGLNQTVENLQRILTEREQTIAALETRITGLESDIAEKGRLIAQRDSVIGEQDNSLNTVYYVMGTRKELEQKGIIADEGGFLWFGSTTVLSSSMDPRYFSRVDKRRKQIIKVNGRIEEIVPKRDPLYYAMNQMGEAESDITITDPTKFWLEPYLVIVTE